MLGFLKQIPEPRVRRTLRASALDGVTWGAMFGLAENFIVPFTLLFGATVFEVSLLQGGAQLATGLGQLTGGAWIQKGGSRRTNAILVVVYFGFSWMLTYWGTVLTGSPWTAIVIYCGSLFVANLASPGWLSWMNDMVPPQLRGKYWAARNSLAGLTQFVTIAIAGFVLYQAKLASAVLAAYGVLFTMAFVIRMGGAVCIRAQYEPPMVRTEEGNQMTFLKFLAELPQTNFGRFALFSIFLNFTVVMIYPIIQVYLLKQLSLDYVAYSLVMMTFTIASFVFMTYWGPLTDRFGNRRILLTSALLLPVVVLPWIFVTDWRILVAVQLVSGFVVAGINLSTTNFLFDSVTPERLPKTAAYFNALNTGFAFAGALVGGLVAEAFQAVGWQWGLLGPLTTVFLLIAVFRLVVLGLFARGFREVRDTEPSPGLRYFYVLKPYQDTLGWLTSVPKSLVKTVKKLRVNRPRRPN